MAHLFQPRGLLQKLTCVMPTSREVATRCRAEGPAAPDPSLTLTLSPAAVLGLGSRPVLVAKVSKSWNKSPCQQSEIRVSFGKYGPAAIRNYRALSPIEKLAAAHDDSKPEGMCMLKLQAVWRDSNTASALWYTMVEVGHSNLRRCLFVWHEHLKRFGQIEQTLSVETIGFGGPAPADAFHTCDESAAMHPA